MLPVNDCCVTTPQVWGFQDWKTGWALRFLHVGSDCFALEVLYSCFDRRRALKASSLVGGSVVVQAA